MPAAMPYGGLNGGGMMQQPQGYMPGAMPGLMPANGGMMAQQMVGMAQQPMALPQQQALMPNAMGKCRPLQKMQPPCYLT